MNTEFTAALFDELDSLYPDSDASAGAKEYEVAGANGMYVGVHIMISGLTPGMPVAVEVEGPHTAYRLYELKYVPVEVNTGARQRSAYLHDDVNDSVIRKAPFYVYDVLKPMYNLLMPAGVSCAVAFKTVVEYTRAIERDEWKIRVTHMGKTETLSLGVVRYPAKVDKANADTHRVVNWISYANICRYHSVEMDSPAYFRMLDKYLRMAVFMRQNIMPLPLGFFIRMKDGVMELNEKRFDKYIEAGRSAGIQLFQGMALAGRSEGQGDNDQFYQSLPHDTFTSPDEVRKAFRKVAFDKFDNGCRARINITGEDIETEEGQDTLRSEMRLLNEYLEKRGLKGCWEQCILDEPNDALAKVYSIMSRIAREELPGVSIMEPVLPTHALTGMIDVWCPTNETYENDREYYDARVEAGDKLYVYTCLTPGGKYLNRMLDMQRLRQTYLGWAPAKYTNVTGFLHWGYNQFLTNDDPYDRSARMFSEGVMEFHPKRDLFLPAGDFSVVYPGYNEPLLTTRAEAQRMGLEDLFLLEKIDQAVKDEIVSSVFRGYADYETDIAKYREARVKLLKAACGI